MIGLAILLTVAPFPPLFISEHGGGRCYGAYFVQGEYVIEQRVFGGIDEPRDRTWSPGPGMRYAKVDPQEITVLFGAKKILGRWTVKGARILTWWDLPIIVEGDLVKRLVASGGKPILPIPAKDLVTVLRGERGSLFAVYSTKDRWRVLQKKAESERWSAWQPGRAVDFAPTPKQLYVLTGEPGGGYKEYGARGAGSLWSYSFTTGESTRLLTRTSLAEAYFDSRWVSPEHLLSVLRYPPEPKHSKDWYPSQTELFRLTDRPYSLGRLSSGWEVHAYDPGSGDFIGLHINRSNMGFDFQKVGLLDGREAAQDECVDALDVSTGPNYTGIVGG